MNSSYTACYTMDPNSYAEGTIPLNIDAGLPMAYNGYYTSTGSMAGSQHAQVSSQALKSSRRAPLRYPCEAGPSAPLPTSTSTMAVSMPAKIPPYPIIKTEHSFGVGRVVASGEQSYARLLFDCLMEAPNHRLPLADIYEWVLARSTKAQSSKGKGWQNSIRHNLSMNKAFVKVDSKNAFPTSNKGLDWALRPEAVQLGFPQPTTRFRLDKGRDKKGKKKAQGSPARPVAPMSRLAARHLSGTPGLGMTREESLPAQLVYQQQPLPEMIVHAPTTTVPANSNVQYITDNVTAEQAAWMDSMGSSSINPWSIFHHAYADPIINNTAQYSFDGTGDFQSFGTSDSTYTDNGYDTGSEQQTGTYDAGIGQQVGPYFTGTVEDTEYHHVYDNPWAGAQ